MLAVIVIGIASLPAAFNVVMAWKSITRQPTAAQRFGEVLTRRSGNHRGDHRGVHSCSPRT